MQFALNTLKFEDIREQIIQYLTTHNNYSAQFDFRSSNISYYIDTMAYVAMIMNFNLTHIANNKFLDTTEIRKNGVSRAREIGYTPNRPFSSKFVGTLIYKGTNFNENDSLTIYPRSPFTGSFGNTYMNVEPIQLSYHGNPTQLEGTYTISQGVFSYFQSVTTGLPNSTFTIPSTSVGEENLSVFVIPVSVAQNPLNGLIDSPYNLGNFLNYEWDMVKTFDSMVNNKIYYVEEDTVNEGFPKIVFGNGLFGSIPPVTSTIYCEYMDTLGAAANNENLVSLPPLDKNSTNSQDYTYYDTSNLSTENQNVFSADNFDVGYQNIYNKSFGGSDVESLASIKANAPRYYSSIGRAATKSDYIYILSAFAGVSSVNVVGGNDLYPNDLSQLGNIYCCVVPAITAADFLYNNNIYINPTTENDIANQIEEVAIISTKRHFYKPSYIVVGVTPSVELTKYLPSAEQTKLQAQIAGLISNYCETRYSTLGIPFRSSKISASIDGLDSISSSSIALSFGFAINNNTVGDLVAGINNVIYLPTINVKDGAGNVIGTKNFIMTNDQVVEALYPGDWSILKYNYNDLLASSDQSGAELYRAKLKLLNTYQNYLTPSQSSIYDKLIHPKLSRIVYNSDFDTVPVADFWFTPGMNTYNFTGYSYQDKKQNNVTVSVRQETLPNATIAKILVFTITLDNQPIPVDVARIVEHTVNEATYTLQLSATAPTDAEGTASYQQNLSGYFGVDDTQSIYAGAGTLKTPFVVTQSGPNKYSVSLRVGSATSELTMAGINTIFDVAIAGSVLDAINPDPTINTGWVAASNVGAFTPLSFTFDGATNTAAYIEQSHVGITNSSLFQGYIGTKANQHSYSDVNSQVTADGAALVINPNATVTYHVGDYFICTEFLYVPNETNPSLDKYFYPNDVLFVNATHALTKSKVKRIASSHKPTEINTTFTQGELFIDESVSPPLYYVYNEIDPTYVDSNGVAWNFTQLNIEGFDTSATWTANVTDKSVDAAQSLPLALKPNQIVEILLDSQYDQGLTGDGYTISYPNTVHDKIGTLMHQTVDGWVAMPTSKVKDGDLIIYGSLNGTDYNWLLVENTNRVTPTAWSAVVPYTVDSTVTYGGVTYVCILDVPTATVDGVTVPVTNNPDVSATYWQIYHDRIAIPSLPVGDNGNEMDALSSMTPDLYNVYQVVSDIIISSSSEFNMFTVDTLPSDNILSVGDYLICIEAPSTKYPRGLWAIFNGDIYKYQIDAYSGNSTFPMLLNTGDVITVEPNTQALSTTTTMNFNGGTGTTIYTTGDQIMYAGNGSWIQVIPSAIVIPFSPSATALLGDLIQIGDTDGTLGNSAILDVPRMTVNNVVSDMMFNYNDTLYYTGTKWIKVNPINIYTVPAQRAAINAAGFDSDILVKQTTQVGFNVNVLDQFNNAVIGTLNYNTGLLTLSTQVTKNLNKLDKTTGTLKDIFQFGNYINSAQQMDTIGFQPVHDAITNTAASDFDTNFNQYIVATVNNVNII